MIFTARQLEALLRSDGRIVLPCRARLTPLAQDWLRAKKITVGYSDEDPQLNAPAGVVTPATNAKRQVAATSAGVLTWCDGPSGTAKAALSQVAREANLSPITIHEEASNLRYALKHLATEVKAGRFAVGIVVVKRAGAATVRANRYASLRAIVGTSLQSVEAGLNDVAANVLVLESDQHTLLQLRNMIARFVKGQRQPEDNLTRELNDAANFGNTG